MSSVKYSKEFDPATTAKAMAYEINVSPKHCVEIFNYIRHMKVSTATTILENVIAKKQSYPSRGMHATSATRGCRPPAAQAATP